MEMPKLNAETFRTFLPYAYDYVVGIWWLIAAAVVLVHPSDVTSFLAVLERWRSTAPQIYVPDGIATGIFILLAVTVPYCVTMAVFPFVNLLMTGMLRLQLRWKNRGLPKPPRLPGPIGRAMQTSTNDILRRARAADAERTRKLLQWLQHIQLRVNIVVPTAMLLGVVALHVSRRFGAPNAAMTIAIVVSIVVFVVLAWNGNQSYIEFLRELELVPGSVARGLRRHDQATP